MSYEIETNVPLPSGRLVVKYPFATMEFGDSFLIPCDEASMKNVQAAVLVASSAFRKKNPDLADWKFWTRRVTDGVRVWRAK
jgi:hypothetical protein